MFRLAVRLSASGARSFLAQWTDRSSGRKKRESIGRWGSITIDQARTAARVLLGEVAKGGDPAAERVAKKAADAADRADRAMTLAALIALWSERHLINRRPRYATEAVRALRFAFADDLAKPASRLNRARILAVLDKLDASGRSTMAPRTLAYGRACFAWALKRERVKANPFVGLPAVGRVTDRERTLTEDETVDVWRAAGELPYPFGPAFRFALLTLQRREEVAGARWSEMSEDLAMWRIPGARMKNGKPHDVALAEPMRKVLRSLPRHQVDGKLCDLIFTTTMRAPISGFSKAKIELDKALARVRGKQPMEPFRLHDFRRSGASWLAGAGFDTIAIDKILAHQPTKLRGVAGVYQRHSYAGERQRALAAWAACITKEKADPVVLPFPVSHDKMYSADDTQILRV